MEELAPDPSNWKIKIKHIPEWKVYGSIQFAFIVCQGLLKHMETKL